MLLLEYDLTYWDQYQRSSTCMLVLCVQGAESNAMYLYADGQYGITAYIVEIFVRRKSPDNLKLLP